MCDCELCQRGRRFEKFLLDNEDKLSDDDKEFIKDIYSQLEHAEFDNDCMNAGMMRPEFISADEYLRLKGIYDKYK